MAIDKIDLGFKKLTLKIRKRSLTEKELAVLVLRLTLLALISYEIGCCCLMWSLFWGNLTLVIPAFIRNNVVLIYILATNLLFRVFCKGYSSGV